MNKVIIDNLGNNYKETDENGFFYGCFEPMYLIHPDCPRFKKPMELKEYSSFAIKNILRLFNKVENPQEDDIIVLKLPNEIIHIGLYLGDNKICETFKNGKLHIKEINILKHRYVGYFRMKEVE